MDYLVGKSEVLDSLTYEQLEEMSRDFMERRRVLKAQHRGVVRRMDKLAAETAARKLVGGMSDTQKAALKAELAEPITR